MPGMPDLAEQVERRGEHEPNTHESDMRNQVSVSLYLLTAFLHGSSVHLYNHATSPVFMVLPLFREEWFRQWHREQFSPVVAELQMKAEAVSRHLTDINRRYNVLAKAREDLHLPHDFHKPISRDTAEQLLHHAYKLVTNSASLAASAQQLPLKQPDPLPPAPKHMLAMPKNCTLEDLWFAWSIGKPYAAIMNYFGKGASPPGKGKWDGGKKELQAFRRYEQLLLELERQLQREHQAAPKAADAVIKRWNKAMRANAAGVKWTEAKLAKGFKELADLALKAELTLSDGTKGSAPQTISRRLCSCVC